MKNVWPRFVEISSVLGLLISASTVTDPALKWGLGGATISLLVCIPLFEFQMLRQARYHLEATRAAELLNAEKDRQIQSLTERTEKLADPELMSIYKEDERERLRIEREDEERTRKSQHAIVEAARKNTLETDRLLKAIACQELGITAPR